MGKGQTYTQRWTIEISPSDTDTSVRYSIFEVDTVNDDGSVISQEVVTDTAPTLSGALRDAELAILTLQAGVKA